MLRPIRRRRAAPAAGHAGAVNSVAIVPDGRTAVSASSDTTLKVWDLDGGTERYTLSHHRKPVRSLVLSPDGRLAISFSGERELCVWDLESGIRTTPVISHAVEVTAFALTPDGRRLLSAVDRVTPVDWNAALFSDGNDAEDQEPNGEDYLIKVWDIESRREHSTLVGHLQMITALAVSPDSRRALSASYDRTVRLWDIEASRELRSFAKLETAVKSLVYSPDGRFALAGAGADILFFDLATVAEPRSLGAAPRSPPLRSRPTVVEPRRDWRMVLFASGIRPPPAIRARCAATAARSPPLTLLPGADGRSPLPPTKVSDRGTSIRARRPRRWRNTSRHLRLRPFAG